MQIVIDIPKELYEANNRGLEAEEVWDLRVAVKNGIQLPKGHGRLIDADCLREDFKSSKRISFAERMDISCIVDHVPTIIEADK